MSAKVVDTPAAPPTPAVLRPAAPTVGAGGAAAAALAPAVAAGAALALHLFLPDAQTVPLTWTDSLPVWLHPYPAALEAVLAAALVLAAVQGAWRPLRSWVRHYAPLAAGAVVVFCFWDLITLKLDWLSLPYFPGPDAVLGALVEDRAMLLVSTLNSLRLLMTGYAAGAVAGLVSGVLMGWFRRANYWGTPILRLLGPLPATALVPLVMTFSSDAFLSGVVLIGFAVWFPVTMLTAAGVANVRRSYLDVARTLGAGRLYLIFHVAIPSALPNLFLGLFMGLGASFLTLIVAETVGVQAGLGWYLKWQQGYMEYAKVYAAVLLMMVFFSTLLTLLFVVRDHVLRWQKGVMKW